MKTADVSGAEAVDRLTVTADATKMAVAREAALQIMRESAHAGARAPVSDGGVRRGDASASATVGRPQNLPVAVSGVSATRGVAPQEDDIRAAHARRRGKTIRTGRAEEARVVQRQWWRQ